MSLSVLGGSGSSGGGSNPNLLMNGWFTVNQRNFTSGTATDVDKEYVADRWYHVRGYAERTDDGIAITWDGTYGTNANISHKIDGVDLVGKTVTVSAIIDGELCSASHTLTSETDVLDTGYIYSDNKARLYINCYSHVWQAVVYNNSSTEAVTITAIKLEYGTQSTLSMDSAPDYATELLKCQRYYYTETTIAHSAYANATNVLFVNSDLPAKMRINPTVEFKGTCYIEGLGKEITVTSSYAISSLGYGMRLSITAPSAVFTAYNTYVVFGSFNLSADL